jgi:PH domain
MKNMRLYYYKNDKKTDQPKGIINFDHVSCQILYKEGKENRFYLHLKGVSRIFKLRALSSEDFRMWTYKLTKVIDMSKGKRHDLGIDEKRLAVKSWRVGNSFYR